MKNYALYELTGSACDSIAIRDTDNDTCICVDFDYDEDRKQEIVDAFIDGDCDSLIDLHLTGDDSVDGWRDWDEYRGGFLGIELLAFTKVINTPLNRYSYSDLMAGFLEYETLENLAALGE